MNVKDFINQHNYKNYCEAIIYPNGDIEYAERGHVNKLIEASKKSRDDINKLMPNNASPIHWMVCYTRCVSLWYDFFFYTNKTTNEQFMTIQELVDNGILKETVIGHYTDELERCEAIEKLSNGEITSDQVPPVLNHKLIISRGEKWKVEV